VITRDFKPGDEAVVKEIHAQQNLGYPMIDLSSPLVVAKAVCEDGGQIVGAAAIKLEAETYLFIRPDAPAVVKWDAIRLLQRRIVKQAVALGLEQLVAYVPNSLRGFFRRLSTLGWIRQSEGWTPWCLFLSNHKERSNAVSSQPS
jgi:hypothetical protein